MRILHILSQLPDRTGSGVYLQSLVREAARVGHEQRVLAAANHDQEVSLPSLPEEQLNLVRFNSERLPFLLPGMSDVMPYPSSRYSQLWGEDLTSYQQAWTEELERIKQTFTPDLVHTNHLWLVSALARQVFQDTPQVTSCHGTELRQLDLAPHLADRVLPWAREVDRVLALTPPQADQLVRRFGLDRERVEVMGGAVNTELFCPSRGTRSGELQQLTRTPELEISSRGMRLIYVGKLSQAKGVPSLLDAMEGLRGRDEAATLFLVGGGDDEEAREIKARAEAMEGVHLMGHLPQHGVADLMRACHLLVLPSFFEGLPMVILEAICCGCRVVVTDLPSMRGWPEPGLVGDGGIEKVSLPPMRTVDQPEPEGLESFAARLADALALQLERARQRPMEVGGPRAVRSFGWAGLFARLEQRVYRALLPGGEEGRP